MDEVELATGTLDGRGGHIATGRFRIFETAVALSLRIEDDFTFDGAPEPWWGFGRDGEDFDRSTMFAELASNTGAQTADIPAGTDVASYDALILWCRAVDSLLAVGRLEG